MLTLCNKSQCGQYALTNKRYCAEHIIEYTRAKNRRKVITPKVKARQRIYKSARFKKVTTPLVMERDGYMCVLCGEAEDSKLLIDHINGITFTEADFDPDRCQVLCFVCSGRKDGRRSHGG